MANINRKLQDLNEIGEKDWHLSENSKRFADFMEVLDMYDQGLAARYFLTSGAFFATVLYLGTEKHKTILHKCYLNQVYYTMSVMQMSTKYV